MKDLIERLGRLVESGFRSDEIAEFNAHLDAKRKKLGVPKEYAFYKIPERYLAFGDKNAQRRKYWKNSDPGDGTSWLLLGKVVEIRMGLERESDRAEYLGRLALSAFKSMKIAGSDAMKDFQKEQEGLTTDIANKALDSLGKSKARTGLYPRGSVKTEAVYSRVEATASVKVSHISREEFLERIRGWLKADGWGLAGGGSGLYSKGEYSIRPNPFGKHSVGLEVHRFTVFSPKYEG